MILQLGIIVGFLAWNEPAAAAPCVNPIMTEQALPADFYGTLDIATLRRFYAGFTTSCIWSKQDATALIAALDEAELHGLNPQDFHLRELDRHDGIKDHGLRDVLLTDAALRYAGMMGNGRVELESFENDIFFPFPRRIRDPEAGLRTALLQDNVSQWLQGLLPQQPEYKRLLTAFTRYRNIALNGGWKTISVPEAALKPGQTSPLVPELERRFIAEGDLGQTEAAVESDLYDGPLVEALKRFQDRHGLKSDGVLGAQTVAELNTSADERVNQIAVNLERWRILSATIEPTRLEVNAAAATATLFVGGQPTLQMRTIVGKKETPTPILFTAIRTIILNPSWVVPTSITQKEILPVLKRHPDYLEKHHMHWENNQIVQEPGEENSLGRIKFEIPNSFGIYLHDTPARSFFSENERARSHGCVRLEKPLDLATYLLRDDGNWPRERIEQAIAEGSTQSIQLAEQMPVAIVYWTSFVDDDGVVEFRNDIYGRDGRLMAALMRQKPELVALNLNLQRGCAA